jgi:NAD(P)-dependent dehydrogenase (short-subunit alcohol dehydrogenase family)
LNDLAHPVVVVTGASSGIGAAAAVELAERGATVVPVARDSKRLEKVARKVGGEPLLADFASLDQVRRLAGELLERHVRIDVLVNNAGVVMDRRVLTEDGYEMTFAVNHLAPFLLTNLLLDRLRASAPARVVTTSSGAHGGGRLDFDDLRGERSWSMMRAYGTSKLANILFTRGLAMRVDANEVTANCLHPGVVNTKLGRGAGRLAGFAWTLGRPFFSSPRRGASTIVYLATSEEGGEVTGGYYENSRPVGTSAAAADADLADRLWRESERMVGLAPGGSG